MVSRRLSAHQAVLRSDGPLLYALPLSIDIPTPTEQPRRCLSIDAYCRLIDALLSADGFGVNRQYSADAIVPAVFDRGPVPNDDGAPADDHAPGAYVA
jgi:hypothetical protein